MPRVTAPPVSENNLQTLLFTRSSAYFSALAHYMNIHGYFLSVRRVDQLRRQLAQKGLL